MTDKLDIKLELPCWDISGIYKNFDDVEYKKDKDLFSDTVKKIKESAESVSESKNPDSLWFKDLINNISTSEKIFENLNSYCYAQYSTDTGNSRNLKEINAIENIQLDLMKGRFLVLSKLSTEALKSASELIEFSDYRLFFEEMIIMKKHLLSENEEELSELLVQSGANAWSRMQEAISSNISVKWNKKSGERKTVTELRNMAFDPDRKVRQKAFKKELKGWRQMEIPLAYALNGVKGFNIIINSRKNWKSSLDKSLFQARMEKKSVKAMISAMEQSLHLFHRYFKLKAQALGIEKLAFYDLFAPLEVKNNTVWKYHEGKQYIIETFSSFSEDFGVFAEKAFENNWIDAMPRNGKIGGAYCTSFPLKKESRVLANYNGSFSSVSTIAHELGHAYHFELLKEDNHIHQDYPMTLAETASIFSEILLYNKALEDERIIDKMPILEMFLQEISQVIVDILSRYYFEKSVFKKRVSGELTPQEFCLLMGDAQKKTYGSSIDKKTYHQYMWAVKGHYYIPSLSFYNYPYAFGQLFGIALFNSYNNDRKKFPAKYAEILKSTGKMSVENVALKAGFHLDSEEFWLNSFKYIERLVDRFEQSAADKEK